ncbi:MAG: hypothetical protein WC010_00870 [Candidatus Absconditabacterales bacterium]
MLYIKHPNRIIILIFMPILWTLIIPLAVSDLWIEIYHRIFFPLYKIPYVKRGDYIQIMDRAKLPYLNIIQKIYCMYCGYANGLVRYWVQIAGETEHYRCGIQHQKRKDFISEEHQKDFSKYGDKNDFLKKYCSKGSIK